ncbi:MAG: Na(+)/H(+) antiporter subunit D [bacterium]
MLSLPPAFYFIFAAIILPFLPKRLRNIIVVGLPLGVFYVISQLSDSLTFTLPFLNIDLSLLRIDKLSKAFGYIFCLSSFAAFVFGYHIKKPYEFMAALLYIGSALGVVFAGDLLSLYLFWEVMAIGSAVLIFMGTGKHASKAGYRYLLVHIFGGLVLLAGIILYAVQTGSLAFNGFETVTMATSLILVGFLINAAAVPFSTWLPDAYPESTVMGGVILSAYTSKTAVYTLIRGFAGWEILIAIGCLMAIYGIIYALLENDIRRVLAYSIVNQVGFMVCAVGIGSKLALAGAVAHAFCHIIYKGLLWMSAGAVIHQTGKHRFTDLGGLYKAMPFTLLFGFIGALAIAAPFTSGFVSKTLIIIATEKAHLFVPWLILEGTSAAVFIIAGIKFPYFIFFGENKSVKSKEAPKTMLIAMGILASLCIYIGCFPKKLYDLLPYSDIVLKTLPSQFYEIYIHHFSHVVVRMQLLFFSILLFFLFLPLFKKTNTLSLDFDWVYRKGGRFLYGCLDKTLNGLNSFIDHLVVKKGVKTCADFSQQAPAILTWAVLKPLYLDNEKAKEIVYKRVKNNHLSVSLPALAFLAMLTYFIYHQLF